MKSIFYLLTILFFSLLLSCSEEPPTTVESETLTKKPIKDPPVPPPPLELNAGDVHIISRVWELKKNKYTESFRVWTNFNSEPQQIREPEGTQIDLAGVAIYDINNDEIDELLVYNYYTTGNRGHAVEHFELQIWQDGDEGTPTLPIYDLDGFNVHEIIIGELDGLYAGDEIVLAGFNRTLGQAEFRVFNPNWDPGNLGFFNSPIKVFELSGFSSRLGTIGDVAGSEDNEIIFCNNIREIAVLDYDSENLKTYDANEQVNAIAVAYVEGEGLDEIIWGGNGGAIHILEFDGTDFNETWYSENLGSSIRDLAAGEFDGDLGYEFAVSSGDPSTIYVYESSDHSKIVIDEIPEGAIAMFAGNVNNDPGAKKDLVVGTRTSVKAYDGLNGYNYLINVDIGAIVSDVYLK